MEDFYTRVMGLVVTDRGKAFRFPIDLVFLSSRPDAHHQFVLATGRPADADYSVINQMSFEVASLEELREMNRRVQAEAISLGLIMETHGQSIFVIQKAIVSRYISTHLGMSRSRTAMN